MEEGKQVEWSAMTPGTMYFVWLLAIPNPVIGTMEKYDETKDSVYIIPYRPWLSSPQRPVRLWKYDVKTIFATRSDFAEKLALLNSKTQFDPGVLSEIMKFEDPNFKPGPWTKMVESQKAVAASKGRGRKTRRRRRTRTTRRR